MIILTTLIITALGNYFSFIYGHPLWVCLTHAVILLICIYFNYKSTTITYITIISLYIYTLVGYDYGIHYIVIGTIAHGILIAVMTHYAEFDGYLLKQLSDTCGKHVGCAIEKRCVDDHCRTSGRY